MMVPEVGGRPKGTLWASDGTGTLLLTGLGDFRWNSSHSEGLIYQFRVEDLGAGAKRLMCDLGKFFAWPVSA